MRNDYVLRELNFKDDVQLLLCRIIFLEKGPPMTICVRFVGATENDHVSILVKKTLVQLVEIWTTYHYIYTHRKHIPWSYVLFFGFSINAEIIRVTCENVFLHD